MTAAPSSIISVPTAPPPSPPPPAAPGGGVLATSIAGRAGHAFPIHTILQGFACHGRGVELSPSGPALVRARVRSKRMHDVELRAEDNRLVIACSCAARTLGLVACKHAWAALLEIDRNGGLDDLRGLRGSLCVVAREPLGRVPPASGDAPPTGIEAPKPATNPERRAKQRAKASVDATARAPQPAKAKPAAPPRAAEPGPKRRSSRTSPRAPAPAATPPAKRGRAQRK